MRVSLVTTKALVFGAVEGAVRVVPSEERPEPMARDLSFLFASVPTSWLALSELFVIPPTVTWLALHNSFESVTILVSLVFTKELVLDELKFALIVPPESERPLPAVLTSAANVVPSNVRPDRAGILKISDQLVI